MGTEFQFCRTEKKKSSGAEWWNGGVGRSALGMSQERLSVPLDTVIKFLYMKEHLQSPRSTLGLVIGQSTLYSRARG